MISVTSQANGKLFSTTDRNEAYNLLVNPCDPYESSPVDP